MGGGDRESGLGHSLPGTLSTMRPLCPVNLGQVSHLLCLLKCNLFKGCLVNNKLTHVKLLEQQLITVI